ncbi:TRAP transporter substrate-binding protein [Ornithinimicrobium pekingense]|uniref:TRAP-type C4-dicarboxylate transport system substrate-binding protein n=1 Tax=Ornithinimicrobium pekingense TaxID=384677 RepID=A0ABQ2F8F0_9MICO|nr:TRAP transporter substrate-binding protein DctP [Ornithinimicrobium pekingense]GGK71579.1 hypothetical protein GCM10011509_20100 [Ornithinimicrobium pekingense]
MKLAAVVAVPCALMLALAGCRAEAGPDKAGSAVRVITLASVDAVDNNGMSYGPPAFVDALGEVSEGALRVEVDLETFGGTEPDTETRLVEAIAQGRVDGGWPSTRAFAAAGIEGLEVVEAPLTLTSYAAVGELVTSATAGTLLERLEGSGVVGLGLAVGPLRRPMAADRPLVGVGDWGDVRFRSYASPVQDATVRALGGEPVHVTYEWPEEVRAGRLDGVELDVAQYHHNGMTTEAGHITGNVVLWPKVFVLSLSEQTWDALTEEQRGWVRQAADRAVRASVEGEHDEDTLVRELCESGAQVHLATETELAELHRAVAPVLHDLQDDPVLAEVRAIGSGHPVDALDARQCRDVPLVTRVGPGELDVPDTPAALPDGVYRVEIGPDDVEASGLARTAEGATGVWTLRLADGTFQLDCTPLRSSTGTDCDYAGELPADHDANPREVGWVTGTGDTAYLTHDTAEEARLTDCDRDLDQGPTSCLPPSTHRVRWSLDGDVLTLSDLVSEDPSFYLVVKPWRRIG